MTYKCPNCGESTQIDCVIKSNTSYQYIFPIISFILALVMINLTAGLIFGIIGFISGHFVGSYIDPQELYVRCYKCGNVERLK